MPDTSFLAWPFFDGLSSGDRPRSRRLVRTRDRSPGRPRGRGSRRHLPRDRPPARRGGLAAARRIRRRRAAGRPLSLSDSRDAGPPFGDRRFRLRPPGAGERPALALRLRSAAPGVAAAGGRRGGDPRFRALRSRRRLGRRRHVHHGEAGRRRLGDRRREDLDLQRRPGRFLRRLLPPAGSRRKRFRSLSGRGGQPRAPGLRPHRRPRARIRWERSRSRIAACRRTP